MPNRITLWQWIVYSLRIRRVEYRVAEIPLYLMPVLLTAEDAGVFAGAVFWEGGLVFFFLFAFGDLVNCLVDRDLDANYKPHLTEAVYGLGVRGVLLQAVFSAAAAVLITLHLAWLLDRPLLVPMVLAGVALAWAYSAPPLRLKARGLWQLTFYWLGLFAGPMIFAASLFAWPPPIDVVLFTLTFGLLQTGVILVNTAEDFPEDRELGVRTAIVATGLYRGMWLAFGLAAAGWGMLAAIVMWMAREQGVSIVGGLVAVGPLILIGSVVAVCILRLAIGLSAEPSQAIDRIRDAARLVPLWITGGALASLWATGVLFWLRMN